MNYILSSCRLGNVKENLYTHKVLNTHCTKEVIQYIKYLSNEILIPHNMEKFIFRGVYLNNIKIIDKTKLQNEFLNSKNIFIEICSRKKYIKNNFYIHHLAADSGDASKNVNHEKNKKEKNFELVLQNKEELEKDILEILNLLKEKNVYFITHIDCKIEKRKSLINDLVIIFKKHNIKYFNPSDFGNELHKYMNDYNHYNEKGLLLLSKYIKSHFNIY